MQNHAENEELIRQLKCLFENYFHRLNKYFLFQIIRLNGILEEKLNQPGCTVIIIFEDFFLGKKLEKNFHFFFCTCYFFVFQNIYLHKYYKM